MTKLHEIKLGKDVFHARSGQLVLDAALTSGVDFPHDCRAGRCGSCITRVTTGITLGGESRQPGMVHACQARVFSDLTLQLEQLPPVTVVQARIVRLTACAEDIVELTIAPESKLAILPGQYCRFRFRGFPPRPFSPTATLTGIGDDGLIRLNIKRVLDGLVTPQFGRTIKAGHGVTIEGPFGHAFLRPRQLNRLVLVGSGTGFAPVWAIATAALRENPRRPIVLVAASRAANTLYMAPALDCVGRYANVTVKACVDELTESQGLLLAGRPNNHLPAIEAADLVYAAGAPKLVEAVGDAAEAAGALFYADPFEPGPRYANGGWLGGAKALLGIGARPGG